MERRVATLEGEKRDERARRPLSSRTTFLLACLVGSASPLATMFGFSPFAIFFGVAGAVVAGVASFKWYLELEEP